MKKVLFATLALISTLGFAQTQDQDPLSIEYAERTVYQVQSVEPHIQYVDTESTYEGYVSVTVLTEGYTCKDHQTLGALKTSSVGKTMIKLVEAGPAADSVSGCAAASSPTLVTFPLYILQYLPKNETREFNMGVIKTRQSPIVGSVEGEVEIRIKLYNGNAVSQQGSLFEKFFQVSEE